ncbi:MAG: hypothetical protein ABEI96_09970 [Haloarculaceae archaeon]
MIDEERTRQLITFLIETTDGHLKALVRYEADTYETIWTREDVREWYADTDLEPLMRAFRENEPRQVYQTDRWENGPHHATARFYDRSLVIHFPQGDDYGTIVALDPEFAHDLASFISGVIELLHSDSPQDIEFAPDW